MVFSSAIFLFYFLPILLGLYFVAPQRFKNGVLLAGSLLFYAWGEGVYLALMLLSICLNYTFGRWIERTGSRAIITLGVTLNLTLLGFYKYANFITENVNYALAYANFSNVDLTPVHLPLGISFFTFQAISYLIDIYRKEIPAQKNILNLGLYISLFPQLIAGPIVRYKTIIADIDRRSVTPASFASGAERFTLGLAKKMLIANPLGAVVDVIFALPADQLSTPVAWFGVSLYALQIYFDFSGYSDMAIGLGRMFGFKFLENFNYPYIARSIQDFWRRWHISLSTWFRDYLYIPLGGNRVSPIRVYLNLFTVFLLCGLWHGASWNFLIWGAFHGFFLAIERAGLGASIGSWWRPLQHFYVLITVLVSWVFFRAETLPQALDYIWVMFSFNGGYVPFDVIDAVTITSVIPLVAGILLALPLYSRRRYLINESMGEVRADSAYTLSAVSFLWLTTLFFLSVMTLAATTHNPFIYFRF